MQRYVSERGKIVPSRITAVSAKKQRELAQAIKRCALPRLAALRDHSKSDERGFRGHPEADGWGGLVFRL